MASKTCIAGPLFISRVGDDAPAMQVLDAMHQWGMDTAGMQIDTVHPTGAVEVTLSAGQPAYTIVPEQAFDFVNGAAAAAAVAHMDTSLLYYGTLAARNPVSAQALDRLRGDGAVNAFVDINLRAPWWDHDSVRTALQGARWAKLNDEELALVLERDYTSLDIVLAGRELREHYNLEILLITRGSAGAIVVTAEEILHGRPGDVADLVDTVGAGDAFSAVTILGLIQGWPLAQILARALEFAAVVCGMRGATSLDHVLYARHLARWQPSSEADDAK